MIAPIQDAAMPHHLDQLSKRNFLPCYPGNQFYSAFHCSLIAQADLDYLNYQDYRCQMDCYLFELLIHHRLGF